MSDSHPMLNYEIRWRNFRCFRDTGWIEIRPITILLGPNNSGKTSLISPLLLLKQTYESPDPYTPLVTRGRIVDLGSYGDFVFSHDSSLNLSLGLRFHTHDLSEDIEPVGSYPPGAIHLVFSKEDEVSKCRLQKYAAFDLFKRPFLSRNLLKSGDYSVAGTLFKDMPGDERKALVESIPVNFLFTAYDAIDALRERKRPDAGLARKYSDSFTMYLNAVNHINAEVARILRTLSYVGPLRAGPKRYYERGGEIVRSVGIRGENAPDLFHQQYEQISERIDTWIRRFQLGGSIACKDISSDIYEIQLQSADREFATNIADAGFGASQLFPLVIQALVAPEDTITIAEQPEIHLNPSLQNLLADLFVEMATTGHRVIIETHSEHLLLRLRVLVAKGHISSEDVGVYFLSKDGIQSRIRPVTIQPDGHIDQEEWPAGFFSETLRESLTLAEAQFSQPIDALGK